MRWPSNRADARVPSSIPHLRAPLVLCAAFLFAAAAGAWGASATWTGGGGDGNWQNSSNWGGAAYPGSTSGDIATFDGTPATVNIASYGVLPNNPTVTITGGVALTLGTDMTVATFTVNTGAPVTINLNSHTITATTVNFGLSSTPAAPGVTVNVNGVGTISTGTFDTNEYKDNVITLENYAYINVSGTLWGNNNSGTTTTFTSTDGTCTIAAANGLTNVSNLVITNITIANSTYSLSVSPALGPGITSTVTMKQSGTATALQYQYVLSITNAGGTTEQYRINSGTWYSTTQSMVQLGAASSTLTIECSSPIDAGDGVVLTVYLPDGITQIGKLTYIQGNYIWLGGSTVWSAGTNWSTGSAPSGSSDVVIIQQTGNDPTLNVGSVTIGSLTIQGNATLNLGTNSLTANSLSVQSGGTLNVQTGAFTATSYSLAGTGKISAASGTVAFTGAASWSCAQALNQSISALTVNGGASLNAANSLYASGTLTNNSAITMASGTTLSFGAYTGSGADSVSTTAGTIVATGAGGTIKSLNVTTSASLQGGSGATGIVVTDPTGASSAITTTGKVSLHGTGITSLTASAGTLTLNGATTATTVSVNGTSVLNQSSSTLGVGGNLAVVSGATLDLGASGSLSVTGTTSNAGTITATTNAGTQTYTGAVTNTGSITGGGLVDFKGAVTGAGAVTAGPVTAGSPAVLFESTYTGGSLNGNGTTNPDIEFRGNTVLGTFTHNGDRVLFAGGAQQFNSNDQYIGNARLAGSVGVTLTAFGVRQTGAVYDLSIASGYLDLDTNNLGWVTDTAATAPSAGAFSGIAGSLTLGSGAELRCRDFSSGTGHTVTNPIAAPVATITASGNVTILGPGTFQNSTYSTLVMTGASKSLDAAAQIGNLTVADTASVTLAQNLSLAGSVHIVNTGTGGILDVSGSNSALTIGGDWTNETGAGGFVYRNGTATFTGSNPHILGTTTWYDFVYQTAGGTISFSNNPDLHTFTNGFKVISGGANITLTRETAAGTPSAPPVFPADATKFWDISILPAATIQMGNVDVYFSNAAANPIAAPGTVTVAPYATHYNYKWIGGPYFTYSYTEDSDRNGKIDRIRVQAEQDIGNDFSGFSAKVDGYTVIGYSRPVAGPNFYILLQENPTPDTDAVPSWTVERNTTLVDTLTGTKIAQALTIPMVPVDTAQPRIDYTLALPGLDRVFVSLSEPVYDDAPAVITFTSSASVVDSWTVVPNSGGEWDYLVDTTSVLGTATIAAGTESVTIANAMDAGVAATDQSIADSSLPSPTYPIAYGDYSSYSAAGSAPPNRASGTAATHRLSDLLISVPPASATDPNYFVWPIWAKDSVITEFASDDYESLTQEEAASRTIGLVRDFTGSGWLRDQDITLQARVNAAVVPSPPTLRLHYDTNVPAGALAAAANGPVGLWLPAFSEAAFSGIVPYPRAGTTDVASTAPVASLLWNLSIDSKDPKVKSVSTFDFLFTLGNANAVNPLYVARLDIAPGAAVPSNWYRLVKPFTFEIHDVKKQRSNVTILNNVIDPTKDELVRLSYQLSKSGSLTIQVFTLDGDLVDVLYRGNRAAGDYTVTWDGKNRGGRAVARGMYFIRVVGPEIDEIRKVMIVK